MAKTTLQQLDEFEEQIKELVVDLVAEAIWLEEERQRLADYAEELEGLVASLQDQLADARGGE